jgi:hypothetical protein
MFLMGAGEFEVSGGVFWVLFQESAQLIDDVMVGTVGASDAWRQANDGDDASLQECGNVIRCLHEARAINERRQSHKCRFRYEPHQ